MYLCSERKLLRDELDELGLVEEHRLVERCGPVLVPGEGEPLRGHKLLDHRHDAGGGRVVQDTDCVLEQGNMFKIMSGDISLFYHKIW